MSAGNVVSRNVRFWWKTTVIVISVAILAVTLVVDEAHRVHVACSLAANFALLGMALIRLYEEGLLLSPAVCLVFNIAYFSFGNLGAVAGTEGWIASNPGSDAYYGTAGVMTTVGLAIYLHLFFKWAKPAGAKAQARFSAGAVRVDLWAVVVSFGLAASVLGYLSYQYEFVAGGFRDVTGQFSRVLAGITYCLLFMAAFLAVCFTARASVPSKRAVGFALMVALMIVQVSMRSRTAMLFLAFFMWATWVSVRPKHLVRGIVIGMAAAVVMFFAGTVVKHFGKRGSSIGDNVAMLLATETGTAVEMNQMGSQMEFGRRMAGLEMTASVLACYHNGAQPLYGRGLLSAAVGFLPAMLRPYESSERLAISSHYYSYGLFYSDIFGVPTVTGVAEIGVAGGVLVFVVLAAWHAMIWRLAGRSLLLFVSYVAHLSMLACSDLVWEGFFDSVRVWLSCYVLMILLRPFVLKGIRWGGRDAQVAPPVGVPGPEPAVVAGPVVR